MNRILKDHDTLVSVLLQLGSVQELATMCLVNRAIADFLLSTAGDRIWLDTARATSGFKQELEGTHGRYTAMLLLCPWLSIPIVCDFREVAERTMKRVLYGIERVALEKGHLSLVLSFFEPQSEDLIFADMQVWD